MYVTKENVPKLIEAMLQNAAIEELDQQPVRTSDRTGAERQRRYRARKRNGVTAERDACETERDSETLPSFLNAAE